MPSHCRVKFRLIPGFPSWYRVGSNGSVWSRKKKGRHLSKFGSWRPLRQTPLGKTQHLIVGIWFREKYRNFLVHRLMLIAFVGACPANNEGCHKDDNPSNNKIDNLYWGTHKQNGIDMVRNGRSARGSKNGHAKLDAASVLKIRQSVLKQDTLAELYGVTRVTISDIRRRKSWTHI